MAEPFFHSGGQLGAGTSVPAFFAHADPLPTPASPSHADAIRSGGAKMCFIAANGDHARDIASGFGLSVYSRRDETTVVLTPGEDARGHRFHTVVVSDRYSEKAYNAGYNQRTTMERWFNDVTMRLAPGGRVVRL